MSKNIRFIADATNYFAKGDNLLLYCISVKDISDLHSESNDSVDRILFDFIYNFALNKAIVYFNKLFQSRKIYVSKNIEIGNKNLDISQLKPLIEALNYPVKLTDYFYMFPSKSIASMGKICNTSKSIIHDCTICSLKYCSNRKDNRIIVRIKGNLGQDIVQVSKDTPLSEVLKNNGYSVNMDCNGAGECGKCAVLITDAKQPCKEDLEHIPPNLLGKGFCLCCRYLINSETTVDMRTKSQILNDFELSPIVADNFTENGIFRNCDTGYAVAIDLGTTTVGMHLIDTKRGVIIGRDGFINPQINMWIRRYSQSGIQCKSNKRA